MRGDTYNIVATVPALFEAHERRFKKAGAEIERLKKENSILRARIEELEGLLREAHDVCTTRVREPVLVARIAARIDAAMEGKE